jgi:ADP-ribose pyrophosphatase YjhB (NUDIX family)
MIDDTWYVRPSDVRDRTSAGGVVVRRDRQGIILVALTGEPGFEGYILPKGGVKRGEPVLDAARREIAEEAGFTDLALLAEIGTRERLSYDRRRWITTHYFLFQTEQIDPQPTDPRHPYRVLWFDIDVPLPPMVWPEQRALLETERERIHSLMLKENNGMIPERVRYYARTGLESAPVTLERLLGGITDAEADRRPDPERFTLREVVAHLADWEPIWHERLKAIAEQNDPFLPSYDEGQYAIDHDYAHSILSEQLAKFRAGREALARYVASVPVETWSRSGRHGEMGQITFAELVTLVLGHDGYHLRQAVEFRSVAPH